MNPNGPNVAPPPPPRSRTRRVLWVIGLLVLGLPVALVIGLAVAPLFFSPQASDWVVAMLVGLSPMVLIAAARRPRIGVIPPLVTGVVALIGVLIYLAVDDPALRRPLTLEQISPPFAGAEKSFEVLMRYGSQKPLAQSFKSPQRAGTYAEVGKPGDWGAWLTAHRAAIEEDWHELMPLRNWWNELNTYERIGDLTPPRIDFEMISFSAVRSYSVHASAIAGLQAIDGRGDEAFATLMPLLEVSHKLEPSGRTLVRLMIARVMQRTALETVAFVLDHAAVSAPTRARFAAAVAGGNTGEAGARRLVGVEYPGMVSTYLAMPVGDITSAMGLPADSSRLVGGVSRIIFNPRRTFNALGELDAQRQEFAAHRELEQLVANDRNFFVAAGRPRFKNFFGAVFMAQTIPAYNKVAETYWKVEDLRTALAARLTKP